MVLTKFCRECFKLTTEITDVMEDLFFNIFYPAYRFEFAKRKLSLLPNQSRNSTVLAALVRTKK